MESDLVFFLPKADGVFKSVKAGMWVGEEHPDLRTSKLLRTTEHQD